MKEYDIVELIKEKKEYTDAGVKVGDFGTVMNEKSIDGKWYVVFSEFYTGKDIADICVNEEDLKVYEQIPKEKLPKQNEEYINRQSRKTYSVSSLNGLDINPPYMCKMCGNSVIEEHGETCGVCGWIDDETQYFNKNIGGKNPISFNEYTKFWKEKKPKFQKKVKLTRFMRKKNSNSCTAKENANS